MRDFKPFIVILLFISSGFMLFETVDAYEVVRSGPSRHETKTTVSDEEKTRFVSDCPTLYGDDNIPLVIIHTNYRNYHVMNQRYIVDLALWKDGRVIWNKGNHEKVDYQETKLSAENLKTTLEYLKKTIPWEQSLETELSLEGYPTTTFAEIDGKRFLYESEQNFGTTELAWTSSGGWILYRRRGTGNDILARTEKGEEVNKAWTPPRPLNAKSLTLCMLEGVPRHDSKPADVLFFLPSLSGLERYVWENSISWEDANKGKWQGGIMKIRSGKPWWYKGSPYWNEKKEKDYIEVKKKFSEVKKRFLK